MSRTKKLLFFDIDGTLLTSDPHIVPESAKEGLRLAQAQGHLTFINSGRTMAMIPDYIKELGFDGYVCGCGTQIYMNGELLYSCTLPNETCREIIKLVNDCRIGAFFESSNRILYDPTSRFSSPMSDSMKKKINPVDISKFSEEEWNTFTFDKFLICLSPESDRETFLKYCQDRFAIFQHHENVWEVTQKSCSKATGIEFLLKHLGLSREDSFAFGDSVNDLPMLKYAGTSVAMGNSMDEILPFCHYQTTHIDDDGIYNALKHFDLIG